VARAYLDHASTTRARPEAIAALTQWAALPPGDPGRLHEEGRVVRDALEVARGQVADLVGVAGRQVVFTPGPPSRSTPRSGAPREPRPASPCSAPPWSTRRSVTRRHAWPRSRTSPWTAPDGSRSTPCASAAQALGAPPALVHCQWGNHEVGTLQPVNEVVALCREAGVTVHVDAAAACGHVPLDLAGLDADLVSISAHKLGGVPGAGALIVRRGSRFEPLLVGGEQERAGAPGSKPSGLLAFGAAARTGRRRHGRRGTRSRRQIAAVVDAALAVEGVTVVGPTAEERLPQLVCLGVQGVEAEPVLIGLDRAGVASLRSACASESIEPSPVLEAMGVDSNHSLRVSVGWPTTDADCDAFARQFPRVVVDLRALRG